MASITDPLSVHDLAARAQADGFAQCLAQAAPHFHVASDGSLALGVPVDNLTAHHDDVSKLLEGIRTVNQWVQQGKIDFKKSDLVPSKISRNPGAPPPIVDYKPTADGGGYFSGGGRVVGSVTFTRGEAIAIAVALYALGVFATSATIAAAVATAGVSLPLTVIVIVVSFGAIAYATALVAHLGPNGVGLTFHEGPIGIDFVPV